MQTTQATSNWELYKRLLGYLKKLLEDVYRLRSGHADCRRYDAGFLVTCSNL